MLFVTGVTGNVGIELLRHLAAARDLPATFLLRARDEAELQARSAVALATATGGELTPPDVPGFRPVRGDLTREGLGLAPALLGALRAETTHVLHSASLTRFAAPPALLHTANVRGLEHVLAFARGCPDLCAVGHLSTCYTAGRRQGLILEDELVHDQGFVNAYEASKYEAEVLARHAMRELPVAVYRCSLLVGRRDGYVHRPGALHFFLERLHAGLVPLVPGHPEARIDLLPTDHAADVVASLFLRHFEAGATYHVSAGERAPATLEWLRLTGDLFRAATPAWRSGAHSVPDIVDLVTWRHLVDAVHTVGNPTLARTLQVVDSLTEYPLSTKVFDRRRTAAALGDRYAPPDFVGFYPAIVEAGLRGGFWGLTPGGTG